MASKLAGCQYSCFRFHRYEPVIAYLFIFIFIKGCFFWFPLHLKTTALCRAARQIAVFTACVETRQFLWVSLLRAYSPGGKLNALATALLSAALSFHRLRLRLQGYLILFAPVAFVSQCQSRPSRAPSPLVFSLKSTHFTVTLGIPSTSTALKSRSTPLLNQGWALGFNSRLSRPPTDALRPIIPDNACSHRIQLFHSFKWLRLYLHLGVDLRQSP